MKWKRWFTTKIEQLWRFCSFVVVHFFKDDCPYRASALAFTSLLAVVPLMTVGFAFISSFPVIQSLSQPVQDFIFENFVPSTGKILQNYMGQFTNQVYKLSLWGIVFLIATALLLMVTIEHAMNKIWRTHSSRSGVPAFLLYWAILSLAPVFLGLSIAISSYLISLPFEIHATPAILINLSSYALSLIGFTAFYLVVPNCDVKFKHGLAGGIVTTILFESAKQLFAIYLARFHYYELLYGAFAIVPLFFIWVYWVWFIILLGAEVSYALAAHYKRRSGEPIDAFSLSLLWLESLGKKQKEGQGLSQLELIDSSELAFKVDSDIIIQELLRLKLIHFDNHGKIFLSQDLSKLTLGWLRKNLNFSFPTKELLSKDSPQLNLPWYKIFKEHEKHEEVAFSINLAKLLSI